MHCHIEFGLLEIIFIKLIFANAIVQLTFADFCPLFARLLGHVVDLVIVLIEQVLHKTCFISINSYVSIAVYPLNP